MTTKKFLSAVLSLAMVASMTACGGGSSAPAASAPSAPAASAPSAPAASAPAAPSNEKPAPGAVFDDWSKMSADELYAEALKEGGQIYVYATSSKMLKVEEPFEEAYPGLDMVVIDLDNDEVIEKMQIEAETGNITGDVLQCKDSAGSLFYDFKALGYVTDYYPADICEKIEEDSLTYGYPLYAAQSLWYYNTEAFPDGQPINSWWNVLDKNADGSQKYRILCKEIGQEQAYLALFASFIEHADEMAADYEAQYGQPLEYTYDASSFNFAVPENNAGVEYMWRFTQMKMTFIGDGDELVLAVHNSTADDPALALASAGKISNRDESGYNIAWCTGLTPYTALQNIEYMYVAEGCDNPAGARLLIYFCTGGVDGESGGLKPFMKEGNFALRSDYVNKKNPVSTLKEMGAIAPNLEYIYDVFYDVQDMWTYWLNQNPNM